ncbi:hypothetical protein [Bradyrhizobium guangdongense]|uniref:JAB domain-containing protein n=1 Tax=Bradyrhizobium guangdongense TaxID=1325090 RepID=A0A410VEU8_9BRAD|nr:hypothetical protein [Bradyrhizobium guangdongense]QAU42196.1 hypothetical protein X265_34350 [Bradyrhizobium guangdongense]QOZ63255.1 hypothetical protein XH86_34390 [Bradyrhizobium guangdongense]GGI29856.1 hypothetical protein GCM10010987_56550 [Bradyrhizobium guangdongense]
MVYQIAHALVEETFRHFRQCGRGEEECQMLWLSPWSRPETITQVVHPKHVAHFGGFVVEESWLNAFWCELADADLGIRLQAHTHPRHAFHSATDDSFPIIHTPGFLSLVIPDFALGPVGFKEAYLTELQTDGRWREVAIEDRLVLT